MEKIIKHCRIERGRYENTILISYDDQSEEEVLATYFPDERIYVEKDFVGLTRKQAIDYILKVDMNL